MAAPLFFALPMDNNKHLIRTFSIHYREKYGFPVGKIPLDLGIPCPNREKGGCIFCHAPGFTPGYLDGDRPISKQLERGKKEFLGKRFNAYLAYFQQETCTAAETSVLISHADTILSDPGCLGVIFSTRPDALDDRLLKEINRIITTYNKECLFELGLQSCKAGSLELLNRNHSVEDFTRAVSLINQYPDIQLGAHLIFGIPGETVEDMIESVNFVNALPITHLKFHHLQVLKGTKLQDMYERGEVNPFERNDYIDLLLRVLPMVKAEMIIHRLWATSHPDLLIAPKWNILATHLSNKLRNTMMERGLYQGMKNSSL